MRTTDLISWLRAFAGCGAVGPKESAALLVAADRLEDAEERVAIMMEGSGITEDQYQQMKMEGFK